MPTHAQVAAELLRAAATFFRNVADTNADLKEQMETNADTYDVIAGLVVSEPEGELVLGEDQPAANDEK